MEKRLYEALTVHPEQRKPGLLGTIFKSIAEKITAENEEKKRSYEATLATWEQHRQEHENAELVRKKYIEEDRLKDVTAMKRFLEQELRETPWPLETSTSFEIQPNRKQLNLHIGFPQQSKMPSKEASIAARGIKLNIKTRGEVQMRRDYMLHVHGIGFLAVGTAFHSLPTIDEILVSGYVRQPSKTTGKITDEFIYSAKIKRDSWARIDFSNLKSIDPVSCFGSFDIRREMSTTGVFKAIEPFSPDGFSKNIA